MKLLLWFFFLFTISQAFLSLAYVNSTGGLKLQQDKQTKGLDASTESNQRGPGALINMLRSSARAASGGAGRAVRGGGTNILNHPKGSGHSGASSILASPSFSIYSFLVLESIGLLLGLMFF